MRQEMPGAAGGAGKEQDAQHLQFPQAGHPADAPRAEILGGIAGGVAPAAGGQHCHLVPRGGQVPVIADGGVRDDKEIPVQPNFSSRSTMTSFAYSAGIVSVGLWKR